MAIDRDRRDAQLPSTSDAQAIEISVSIEELVVHGVSDAVVRAGLERTFQRELGRLMNGQQLQHAGTIQLHRPLELRLARGDGAQQFGQKLAQTVHGALRK
jgi:hypothetical protein